jgi:hypothetical protein
VLGQRAAQGQQLLLDAAPPCPGIALEASQPRPRQQRRRAGIVLRVPEEFVEALQHLGRADLAREDLVGDARQLVCLVGDHVCERRVIRRPAQQQVVIRNDQVRVGQRSAATPEGTRRLVGALLARALLRPCRDGTAQQVSQHGETVEEHARQGAHLAVAARVCTSREDGPCHPVFGEDARLPALRRNDLEATRTDVVGAALDGEGA